MGNYIKIDRSILDWEWYTDINTKVLFLHMILKANWKDGNFRGTTVPRGSFVSSIRKLADETYLTEREIRTAIKHLETTGEVTHKSNRKYTVFSIKNYDKYQASDTQEDKQETYERHTNDIRTTTIETIKNIKQENNNIYSSCEDHITAAVEKIVLNDGTEWQCPLKDYEELKRLYPGVDVDSEFRKMRAWSLNNATKRKTLRGIKRFVNSWLSREQDKPKVQKTDNKPKNSFMNFEQRNTDYDALVAGYYGIGGGQGDRRRDDPQ